MNFVDSVKACFNKYATFSGRACRSEFWWFSLFNVLVGVVISAISLAVKMPFLATLFQVLIFLPSLAVGIRRLHDTGKSGWMYLVAFIPVIGGIWLLVLFCTDSQPGANEYGENPKGL
jgi:uncharacterized membrane protein YhaH (DUF805 family)